MRIFGSIQPKSESLLLFILSRSNRILVSSYFQYSPVERNSFAHIREYATMNENPEKNNHFYESNFSKHIALDKIFSEIIIFNEGYQLFKFVPG